MYKIPLLPKLTIALLIVSVMQVNALSYAQEINLNKRNVTLRQVFKEIRKQTGVNVLWKSDMLDATTGIDAHFSSSSVSEVMDAALSGTDLTYAMDDRTVVIRRKPSVRKARIGRTIRRQQSVQGKVTDTTGAPLPGVTIMVKGSSQGEATDIDGNFNLPGIAPDAVLVFSMVGFTTQEIPVNGRSMINVRLRSDVSQMEEVIVVGYGTQKKGDVTSAVSQIEGEEMRKTPTASVQNMLAGKLPGLFTQQQSGQPGNNSAAKIYIRGVSTFTGASKQPLVLVDDVEYNFEQLAKIDPNEVESITILKDAASTAIYGVKGANGVILVTTRRGKAGKPVIRAKTQWAMQSPVHRLQMLDAYNTALLLNEAQINDGLEPQFTEEDLRLFKSGEDPYGHPNVDWYNTLFKESSLMSNNNVDISGGGDHIRYFISAGYLYKDGMLQDIKARDPRLRASQERDKVNNNYYQKRYKFRSNLDITATKTLDLQVNLTGTFEEVNNPQFDGNIGNVTEFEYLTPYMYPVYNPDGSWGYANPSWGEPRNQLNNMAGLVAHGGYNRNLNDFMNVHLVANQKLDDLTPGLSLKGSIAYSSANTATKKIERGQAYPAFYYNPEDESYSPRDVNLFRMNPYNQAYDRGTPNRRLNYQGSLNYKRSFGQHNVEGLVLYNQTSYTSVYEEPDKDFDGYKKGPDAPVNFRGYTFRFGYNYKRKYLFQASAGYNGTSRFVTQERYALFPAVSLGWNMGKEPFFKEALPFVSVFKLRGSIGWVGNDEIGGKQGAYLYEDEYGRIGGYSFGETHNGVQGIEEGKQGNNDVAWETERKFDVGVDIELFQGKVSATVDYFNNYRYDILTKRGTIPAFFGVVRGDLPPVNIGEMSNKGYEIELTTRAIIGQVGLRISGNYTYAKNKILFMDEAEPKYPWQRQTGLPFGTQKQYIWEGEFYQDEEDIANSPTPTGEVRPGWLKYKDLNEDGIINIDDMAYTGNPNLPNTNIGLTLGVSYKGFSLTVLAHAALGFDAYAGFDQVIPFKAMLQPIHQQRWTPETAETAVFPAMTTTFAGGYMNPNDNPSTFWTVEGNYIRIRSAELSYNLPEQVVGKVGMNGLRVYTSGFNLLSWSKVFDRYQFDPEVNGGANRFVYPQQRIINFGLEASF